MSKLEIHRSIDLPPELVRDAAIAILRDVDAGTPPYDNVTLSLGLHKVGLPVGADVRVPVELTSASSPGRWECRVHIEAQKRSGLFPRFDGIVSVTPVGPSSELWMQGDYQAPFGALGAGGDATVMRGAAKESLDSFLTWLAQEIQRVVDRTQRAQVERRG